MEVEGWTGDGYGRRVVAGGRRLGWAERVEVDGVSRCWLVSGGGYDGLPREPMELGQVEEFISPVKSVKDAARACVSHAYSSNRLPHGAWNPSPNPILPSAAAETPGSNRGTPFSSPGLPRYTQATVFEARGREVRLRLGDPVEVLRGTAQH